MVAVVNSYFSHLCARIRSHSEPDDVPPSITRSFLDIHFLDKPLGAVLKDIFYQERTITRGEVVCEVVKEVALGALTIGARVPYYQMCTTLFPSVPGLGAAVGVTGAIIPWGTIINAFFHRLVDEWGMRRKLSAESSQSLCAQLTKAGLALTWGVLAEAYSFALVYLTTKRVDLLALSAISVAIPVYSCNGSINYAWERLTSTSQTRANKRVQEMLQDNLKVFIERMPTLDAERLEILTAKCDTIQRSDLEFKEEALRDILREVLQKGSSKSLITREEAVAALIRCLEDDGEYNPAAKETDLKTSMRDFLREEDIKAESFAILMQQLTTAKTLSVVHRKSVVNKLLKDFLKESSKTGPADSCSYKAIDMSAYGFGVFLAAVYLTWVGYLTYAGWKELPLAKDKEGAATSFGVLGALANSYFMYKGMTELCRSVPRSIGRSWNGTRLPSLTEKYYPLLTTTLKVVVIAVALMAFGPSTVLSFKYLPLNMAIASSVFMSSASVLSPMEPMMTAADLAVQRIGRNAKDRKIQAQFNMLKKLRNLELALACTSASSAVALRKFMNESESVMTSLDGPGEGGTASAGSLFTPMGGLPGDEIA